MPVSIYFLTSDTDECQENTSRCSQECNNTIGGYQCYCKDGYSLANDSHTCEGKTMQMQATVPKSVAAFLVVIILYRWASS